MRLLTICASALLLTGCTTQTAPAPASATAMSQAEPVAYEIAASDGVMIHGYPYYGDLPATAPTLLLFHQGGASASGEYSDIAVWLNGLGYRAIAWDLRAGGDIFETPNRTVQGLGSAEAGYCAAYRDVEAALNYATSDLGLSQLIVLGSSYSGSLVYQLAAKNPDTVSGVLAFSPASGGPVAECKADLWAGDVRVPAMVLRPVGEMARESSLAQRDVLTAAGAEFFIADPGTHGASMLLEDRVGGDVGNTRNAVAAWLARHAGHSGD